MIEFPTIDRKDGQYLDEQVTLFRDIMPWTENVIDQIFKNCEQTTKHIWMVNGDATDYLLKRLKDRQDPYILLQDKTEQFDINPYIYAKRKEKEKALQVLAKKSYYQYSAAFKHVTGNNFCWVIEDDVIVPDSAYQDLASVLLNEKIGTVAGRMLDRRCHMMGQHRTVVNDYKVEMLVGSLEATNVTAFQIDRNLPNYYPPTYGVQIVGSTHMGCWLTRSHLLRSPGIALIDDGCLCVDNNWGWRIFKKYGLRVAVNWEVSCKHCYMSDGVEVRAE